MIGHWLAALRSHRDVGAPNGEKPLASKGAAWVLLVSTAVPIPLLIGAILLLEASAISRVVGAFFVTVGAGSLVAVTVTFIRTRPHG